MPRPIDLVSRLFLFGALVGFSACGGTDESPTTPTGGGEDLEWDPLALQEILIFADSTHASGFGIYHKGELIVDVFGDVDLGLLPAAVVDSYVATRQTPTDLGRPVEDVASVQKSVVALLTGIAQDQGLLTFDDPVSDYLGVGWTRAAPEVEAEITIRHIMSMTTGLDEDFNSVAAPGTVWAYNTPVYQSMHAILEAAAGFDRQQILTVWFSELLEMEFAEWIDRPGGGIGLATSMRDLIRVGELILGGGLYEGDRIVSQAVINTLFGSSQELNPSYGLLWWLNGKSKHTLPNGQTMDGWLMPSIPGETRLAIGAHDRLIAIVPSRDLIIARIGAYMDVPGDLDRMETLLRLVIEAAPR